MLRKNKEELVVQSLRGKRERCVREEEERKGERGENMKRKKKEADFE